ncbi:marine proteobacterial sortase target protein [Kordiimonas sp. SCSIO 12610]|uniref:marine proteobacterial sortase target protein n=1 Tax=Kordiimonas sp. SCSIO 12610 TaxID=2829597 RepID=UPI00210BC348|nr:marine proteobacterial sortase target protein [Kordiimonas sp. SCSIO 12610]UTW56103.1 marine proteobacterial sortase target protein [Kordiimonas sp. SCSIO 12610]
MTQTAPTRLRAGYARTQARPSKQKPNDLQIATTLYKAGTIFQIGILILSLLFAFSVASAASEHGDTKRALGGLKIVPIRSADTAATGEPQDNSGQSPSPRQPHGTDVLPAIPRPSAPIIEDALLLASEIDVKITGMIVHTTVKQTFKNQTADWIEGMYRFPLPDNAAVDSMTMIIGDRRIVGKIKEKEAAKKIYTDAVKAGKKAALLQEHRPNMFSTRVGNVAPGALIAVELTFLSTAGQNNLKFDWTMPQAITPRFNFQQPLIDGDGTSIAPSGVSSGADLYDVKAARENPYKGSANKTSFSVHLNAGTAIENLLSTSHDLSVTRFGEGEFRIALKDGALPADRDFNLSWELVPGSNVQSVLFRETGPLIIVDGEAAREDADYILGFVLPPNPTVDLYVPPRDVVFIIDTSGSMGGASIRQAKTALLHAVDLLRPEDKFDIIEFNSNHTRLFGNSEMVTSESLARARHFIRRLDANGGTNMMPALKDALDDARDLEAEKQILFLTDGAVGYEDAMFRLVEEKLGSARLFTVGIGSAPNGWFMRKAAEFGRGLHIQIGDVATAGVKLEELYSAMARPSLSSLSLSRPFSQALSGPLSSDLDDPTGENNRASIESYPATLPDLFGAHPAVFMARVQKGTGLETLQLSGVLPDGGNWQKDLKLSDVKEGKGIAKMWARKKVEGLMDARVRGANPDMVRKDILDVALMHKILSPFTSFVAVEEKISRPQTDALKLSNAKGNLPHGTEAKRFHGPRTATPLSFKFISGLIAFFLALVGFLVLKYPLPRVSSLASGRLP